MTELMQQPRLSPRTFVTERDPSSCILVIFGATGDLTRRKLIPSLYSLSYQGLLPAHFAVVGVARRDKPHDEFRDDMRQAVQQFARFPFDASLWGQFAQNLYYHRASFEDALGYVRLREFLPTVCAQHGIQGHAMYYLATPPEAYYEIAQHLHTAGLAARERRGTWPRIVVEKPFGRDLTSSRLLNNHFRKVFREEQLYRIDHYLGKETVQNILVLRFANSIFEPLWHQKYIDHVQITVSETLGVEDRGGYYDTTGALRDMMQNHLLQLLTLTAMEPPGSLRADAIRNEKLKVLESIRPLTGKMLASDVVRAQYAAGRVDSQDVVDYLQEPLVKPDSTTETFVAMRLWLDNWRWAGVPFYLRSGKRLPQRCSEIAIQFKAIPHVLFHTNIEETIASNVLVLRIQPDEGASLSMAVKAPGLNVQLQPVHMNFHYGTSFTSSSPEAYERLLRDVMLGDQTLFMRGDEVEAAWGLMTPILEYWDSELLRSLPTYAAGTWGPAEALALLAADGRQWRLPEPA
jgi:glucose-6-phosphate 1-dehydrogenase